MSAPSGYTALDFVGFTDKGTYSPIVKYMRNDLVHHGGNIMRCKVDDTLNVTPVEGANWELWIGASANLVERVIAPLENNPADVAFGVGRQIIYDDWLWEVIAPIAVGDALIDYAVDPTNANIKKSAPVETQLLAVKAEADATDNMIAPTEANASSSSAPYSVGDQLILNNILYDVIAAIQIGDALTTGIGGNIAAAGTLTDQLNAKANSSDLATVATSGSYNDLSNKPTLGTAAAKDSTNAVTSGSTDLVESGVVYTEIQTLANNKFDKSGGTLSGNLAIIKTTYGSVTVTYNNPSTSKANVASIFADNEGGNLSLSKENNAGRIQIDTQPMNGSTGYGRMMLGDSSNIARKVFKFNEDGSFTDGNGVNTKTLNDSLTKRTAVLNGKTFSMTAANRTIPNYTPGKKYCIVIYIDANGSSNSTTCVSQEFIGSDIINQFHIIFGNGFVGNIFIDILTNGVVQLENTWKISGSGNEYIDLSNRYFTVYEIA